MSDYDYRASCNDMCNVSSGTSTKCGSDHGSCAVAGTFCSADEECGTDSTYSTNQMDNEKYDYDANCAETNTDKLADNGDIPKVCNITSGTQCGPDHGSCPFSDKFCSVDGECLNTVDALTYTPDATKCYEAYNDEFQYSITDEEGLSNTDNRAVLDIRPNNCVPTSVDFNQAVTGMQVIDFSDNVEDLDDEKVTAERNPDGLKIKLTSLPTKGVLKDAIIGKVYDQPTGLKYYSNARDKQNQ